MIVILVSHGDVEGLREVSLTTDIPASGSDDLAVSVWQWFWGEWQAEDFGRLPLREPSRRPSGA